MPISDGVGDSKIIGPNAGFCLKGSMEHLRIRDAAPDDLAPLQLLYRHLNPDDDPCSPAEARDIFSRFALFAGSAIVIGEVGNRLVTSCTMVVIPNLTRGGRSYALIENVVTHGEWRKRGFGSAILDHVVQRAWQAGCYKAMLMTGSKDPATLAFYVGAGFERSKTGFQVRHPGHSGG